MSKVKRIRMKELLKRFVDKAIIPVCQEPSPLGKLAIYVSKSLKNSYNDLRMQFIQNGKQSRWNETVRATMVERFETIDAEMMITTTPTDGLFLAEALLSLEAEGSVVECGCYTGGSTAKLSIVTKTVGKKLFVFDSFEGLPEVDQASKTDYHTRGSWAAKWDAGRYAASLDQVKSNVEKYGEISVCAFHEGWFSNTLKEGFLPNRISFAFADVDQASSARECLIAIWPRISDQGVYFSHDVAYIKVLQTILNKHLWREIFREFPPILFGAGYGLGDSSPHLGFMVKGESVTAEYINSLTIGKWDSSFR